MTQETGILQENPKGQKTTYKSLPLHFQIEFKPTGSGRRIKGRISSPNPDRENEVISPAAMRHALANFMKHPILHLQHTERPVGHAIEAIVKSDGDTFIEAEIYDTSDTDDVWELIQKGVLNKFSIFGRRKQAAGQCHIVPHMRKSACITKALDLWSISIVGNNAVNQETYLEIAKAHLKEEDLPFYSENLGLIYKSEPGNEYLKGDTMVPEPQKKTDATATPPEEDKDIKKSDENQVKDDNSDSRLEAIEKSLGSVTAALDGITTIVKGLVPEKKDEPPEDPIVKAKLEVEPIVKAQVEAAVGDIKKSVTDLSTSVDEIKKAVEEMKSQIIRKGGQVVFIQPDKEEYNPQISNLTAIGGDR